VIANSLTDGVYCRNCQSGFINTTVAGRTPANDRDDSMNSMTIMAHATM
jgi:hypothetical protein